MILLHNLYEYSFFPTNLLGAQKYESLLCSAPAVDFDCSGLYDPRLLLKVVAQAAAEHSGQPVDPFVLAFSTLKISSAAAASVKSINLSHNWLNPIISVELQQLLHRFPALQHVNVSVNLTLGSAGVTSIVSSLTGAYYWQTHARSCSCYVMRCDDCFRQHQEPRCARLRS